MMVVSCSIRVVVRAEHNKNHSTMLCNYTIGALLLWVATMVVVVVVVCMVQLVAVGYCCCDSGMLELKSRTVKEWGHYSFAWHF